MTLKKEEFHRHVNEALASVADKMEGQETMEKLQAHHQGRFLFFSDDSVATIDLQAEIPDSLIEFYQSTDIIRQNSQVEVRIIEEDSKNKVRKFVSKRYLGNAPISELQGEGDIEIMVTPEEEIRMTTADTEETIILRDRVAHRTTMVADVVKSLMEVNVSEPISDRLNRLKVDSLLVAELGARGIDLPFHYAVVSQDDSVQLSNLEKVPDYLKQSPMQVRLFPNDVFPEVNKLNVVFPEEESYLLQTMSAMLATSAGLILAVVFGIYFLFTTIIRQKKLSLIKNDFINNMTHELKTPISTISLACEALKDPDLASQENTVDRYVGMIRDENKRLALLVEEVLQSAVLDKGDFKLKREQVDLHLLIANIVDKIGIQIRERSGSLSTQLKAENHVIMGDPVHLTNVFYNLIDNANKYSKENPDISISTENKEGGLLVSVKDKGIGISKENLKKVFDRLYRVPTGNLHDVKGFGLGLSYVKVIADRHHGSVSATSEPGQGSTFRVYLPL